MVCNPNIYKLHPNVTDLNLRDSRDPPLSSSSRKNEVKTSTQAHILKDTTTQPPARPRLLTKDIRNITHSAQCIQSPISTEKNKILTTRIRKSSSLNNLALLEADESPKIFTPRNAAQKIRDRDARALFAALPIHRKRIKSSFSTKLHKSISTPSFSEKLAPCRSQIFSTATQKSKKDIIEEVFSQADALNFLELKRGLTQRKKQFEKSDQANFDLDIAMHTPPTFSLYYLNTCTDRLVNPSPLSCSPQEFLACMVVSLKKIATDPTRKPLGTYYAKYFTKLAKHLWEDYGLALMGNADNRDIIAFLQAIQSSPRKDIGEFCLKFQQEWIKNLLRAGHLMNVLQEAHKQEIEMSVAGWKPHLFSQEGMTNSLSQSYLNFIHRPHISAQSGKMIKTIMEFPNWPEAFRINPTDMNKIHNKNIENFKRTLKKCLSELCLSEQPYLNQLVLTIRRRIVEKYLPTDDYPEFGIHFALDFFFDCLRKEFKVTANRQFPPGGHSAEKAVLNSFNEALNDLKTIQKASLENDDKRELERWYPIAFDVWREMETELKKFIERNTRLTLKLC